MDLAVILPLSVLFCLQSLLSLLLLSPRALSKHIAGLLSLTYTNKVVNAVMHTVAVAISAMTISSLVQLLGVLASLNKVHHGDRWVCICSHIIMTQPHAGTAEVAHSAACLPLPCTAVQRTADDVLTSMRWRLTYRKACTLLFDHM